MDKHEYLRILRNQLDGLPYEEIDSIMFEYQSHFEDGAADGKSDDIIANELGDPQKIGKDMKAMYHVNYAEKNPTTQNTFRAILAIIGLSFVNLFVLLIPFIIIVAILFSIAVTSLVFIVSPLFLLLDIIINGTNAVNVFEISLTSFMFGLGLMLAVGVTQVTLLFNRWLIRYIKYNVKLVKGGASA